MSLILYSLEFGIWNRERERDSFHKGGFFFFFSFVFWGLRNGFWVVFWNLVREGELRRNGRFGNDKEQRGCEKERVER